MKYFVYLFFVSLIFTSCNTKDSCFAKAGDQVTQTIGLPSFDVIDIPQGFTVEIIESIDSKIEIESKENYLSNLDFQVNDSQLMMTNAMSCSMFHSYEIAKVRIYTPTLKKIISRTQLRVSSVGTLKFPELYVITSVDTGASSEIDLKVDNAILRIEDNQVGFFKISGKTIWLDIALYGGNGRVEAQDLYAQDCTFFQRSSNDIFVRPEKKLSGTIYATGNVFSYTKPIEVDVKEMYKGKLIYK